MEIKVQCDCGQRYAFEVEPVAGQMPSEVACPACGVDGTGRANAIIAARIEEARVGPIDSGSTPKLRLSRSTPALEATPAVAEAAKEPPLDRPFAGIGAAGRPVRAPAARAQSKDGETPERERSFVLSVAGVIVGAVLGAVVWYFAYKLSGGYRKLGVMALVTGILAGVAPQVIGHYRSQAMGIIAAVCTICAIFTTQYLNAKTQFGGFVDRFESETFRDQVEYARRAVKAVPSESDEEIRIFLSHELSDSKNKVEPGDIEPEDLKGFRASLPRMRDLASGKITQEEFGKDLRAGSEKIQESEGFSIYLLIRALGIFNIVNIFLGVGAAYLTAKGDSKDD